MLRVHISPVFDTPDQADGGIRRVVEAQVRGLAQHGVAVVRDPAQADLCAVHGALIPPRADVPLVAHCHGLMWSDYAWPPYAESINRAVIDTMTRAAAVTAPSAWVARAISRGMLLAPEVIYHGVDADAWTPEPSGGYVLWNKARADAVSDPRPVGRVAAHLPDVPFVTTFGAPGANVHVTGALPLTQMRPLVQRAGVYLATARETFGIGTLEALAAGVPVVGYAYGGQREIVVEGETGYLVEPGDDAALAEAIRRALAERARLGANARADAIARWGWDARIAQYAALYARVHAEATAPRPRVSVVITTYNLNRYLPEAVASARGADEVIVIDDAGAEDARDVYPDAVRLPANVGLSGARNAGAQRATGRYLLFLDADDMLAPGALDTLARALDADPGLHIAAGGLQILGQDGPNPWPDGTIDARRQAAHLNQLHYAAMWRRDAFARTGGYRVRDWRAEDAAHWLRALQGGLRARQVTDDATLIYRIRPDSKSQQEAQAHPDRDGDWTSWFPWRLGAASGRQGASLVASGAPLDARQVPFGAPPPAPRRSWPVWHHEHPLISVVIPVGPGHDAALIDALDSLTAQTFGGWEAIVVNDTGASLPLPGHPWATVLSTPGGVGAGAARNAGLAAARAPLVLFLDADDVLLPGALRALLEAYSQSEASYIYPACLAARAGARIADAVTADTAALPTYADDDPAPLSVAPVPAYDQALWLRMGQTPNLRFGHGVTALIETDAARAVGGFDTELPALEDQEFYLRLAAAGYCGARLASPQYVYRLATGRRRAGTVDQRPKLMRQIAKKYKPVVEGAVAKQSCCGGVQALRERAASLLAAQDDQPAVLINPEATVMRLKYVGPLVGEHTISGPASGTPYRVGNNAFNRFANVDPRDAEHLLSLRTEWGDTLFEVVR